MAGLTLAEELALLGYDDESGKQVGGMFVSYGLAGALLAELALLRRIELTDKRVAVTDPSPTGDALLDDALRRVAEHPGRRPARWVDVLRKGVERAVLDRLVASGYLRREEGRALFVVPVTRYPAGAGTAERDARLRLADAVRPGSTPDQRTVTLALLAHACGMDAQAFPGVAKKVLHRRLDELAAGDWAAQATMRAVEVVRAALLTATTTAATSGT
ncbi:MAG: GPP34 family phosphoprotein [Streptosporangiales bacterium]|nr:GPP34 family phosphoprotein [Streptosporangiales bacterium]MBO0891513.1 GPP34 family phosphoprotein [Acidothermales bacterium]